MDLARLFLRRRAPRVALIRLQGAIGISRPGSPGLSDAALAPVIERAFRKGKPAAVALVINSPGGSPVQSSLIAARIRRLADEAGVPVHAFVEDVAASGGYWLACAADDIWADETSVVGSIGVISSGFGLDGLIGKHGIERRVHTAGGSKSFLDPFRPEKPEDIARLTRLLEDMHRAFKAHVTARRGTRLSGEDLFTGEIWTGAQAVATGLIDGTAHAVPKLKALYGDKVRIVPVNGPRRSWLRLPGTGLGAEVAGALLDTAEERALWARYGL
ncbi:serine protease SohB [Rhodobacter sp. 140A]|uniref:Putative protease SohB n=1 Tax=bioreactor metagenome TaxID=1076179 RepID=A0A644TLK9_9ZZZZ|nr:serine protease SohB [Rhodobacter sp. 140A]